MAAHEQAEIERKYDVDASASVPDLAAADGIATVERLEPVTLTAVYFDTANLDLAAHRIILRRRQGGPDEGWHIKKPAEEGRTELHWPLGTARSARSTPVPEEVLEPVRVIVRDRALSPLARISTVRTALHLRGEQGEPVAEVADDLVSSLDERSGTLRTWREWEVELLPAAPDTRKGRSRLLDAIERILVEAGAHPSPSVAKVAQALGAESLADVLHEAQPEAGHEAQPEAGPEARPEAGLAAGAASQSDSAATAAGSVGSVVVAAVRRLTDALEGIDPAVRADEPDAVHQMRRAVRRLRSVLASNRRLFDPEAVGSLRDDLAGLSGTLGEARDAEVRGHRAATELGALPAHRSEAAVQERLVGGAHRDYAEGHEHARQAMSGFEYYRLLDSLDDFAAHPPLTARASRPVAPELRKALRRDVARLRARSDTAAAAEPGARDAALHDVRKALRRLRNAVDAIRPEVASVLSAKKRRTLRRISKAARPIEKALGERHDLVLFAQRLDLASSNAHEEGEETFLYGMLAERSARELDLDRGVEASVRRIEQLARGF